MTGRTSAAIAPGTTVRDLTTGRVGILMAYLDRGAPYGYVPGRRTGTLAYLRPVGGGVEWTTEPDQVERVSPH